MSVQMHSLCENQAMMAGVNITKGEWIRCNHSAYDKGRTALWVQRSHSLSEDGIKTVDGQAEQSVVQGNKFQKSNTNKKCTNINFSDLCMCTHTLVGNLRLWSVISNMSRL